MARYTITNKDTKDFRGFDECEPGSLCTEATHAHDLNTTLTEAEMNTFDCMEPAAPYTSGGMEFFVEW